VSQPADHATKNEDDPASGDVRTARLLVAGQLIATVVGLAVMVFDATGLGRGLTATPLPNAHAKLRTGGLYRYARHPIYSGLLLTMASITMASGSVSRLLTLGVLVLLLTVKARWEETRLMRRIEGYADYAARTPRFVPRLRR